MSLLKPSAVLAIAVLVCAPVVAHARDQAQQTGAPQGMPPPPKPGPEHAIFNEDAGTWDAVVEFFAAPGQPPMTSKGVETNTIGCGGLCLITDFKGEMTGTSFHGHGISTWDVAKKKYVGVWTDSMSQGLGISEGTWDAATRTMSGYMEGPDMSGQVTKIKSVGEYKKDGTRVMTMYSPASAGKETPTMRITYTRKK